LAAAAAAGRNLEGVFEISSFRYVAYRLLYDLLDSGR
jgi:hypothetical protein